MSNKRSIKEIFDGILGEIFTSKDKVKHIANMLYQYQMAFVNKNSDHIEFFGSNLTGHLRVAFTNSDVELILEDILGISKDIVDYYIRTDSDINTSFKISSDCFNLTVVYLAHMFYNSKYLGDKDKHHACKVCISLFLYRSLSIVLNTFFKYLITRETAEAVYAQLTRKFLIKKLGSWGAVIDYRAEEMISKNNPNFKAISMFTDDDVVRYINDSQGRIKDMFKNMYLVFRDIKENGEVYKDAKSSIINADGEEEMVDMSGGADGYINYMIGIMSDQHSFIKPEVVEVISSIIKTTQRKYIEKSLIYLSVSMTDSKLAPVIENLVRNIIGYSYEYLQENRYLSKNSHNLVLIVSKLKGVFMASKNSDSLLLDIKDSLDQICKEAIGKINIQALAATRTAVMLYICLRCYGRHKFIE